MHENLIEKLYQEFSVHGFISEDRIFDVLDENGVSLLQVDYICDQLLSRGVIIRDESPAVDEDEDEYDRSNTDYDAIYAEILEIDEDLRELVEYVKEIQAPQHRECHNLIGQAKLGNAYARNRIFEMYMRVALKQALGFAKKYKLPLSDTIQDGLSGLHIAIDKFEIGRQDNFSTYFPFWVRQQIMREAQTLNPSVYFPVHVKDKLFAIYDNMDMYYGEYGEPEEPGDELLISIAEELECDMATARKLFDYLIPFESLEQLLEDEDTEILFSDNGFFAADMLEMVQEREEAGILHEQLNKLNPREKEVMELRYGIGIDRAMTLEEVGISFDVTRERVRQIEAKSLRKLRRRFGIKEKEKNED